MEDQSHLFYNMSTADDETPSTDPFSIDEQASFLINKPLIALLLLLSLNHVIKRAI